MEKLRLNIDGKEVTGYSGQTILEVALENGINIPTLCHDKRMDTYGSCGICVVEAEGMPKLLRSCATTIDPGMVIKTNTKRVRESRKTNLELLLSQHIGDCRAPCVLACPGQTDCQGYVGLIANGETEEALKLIKDKVPLPASLGRVCPHPCEDACRRQLVEEPVSILNLKRYAADLDLGKADPYLPAVAPPTGKSVAVIGGGPGGLSAAYFLAQLGHDVTVLDQMPKMGGMLRYGIPEYRLPKTVLEQEVRLIEKLGVAMKNNVKIGRDVPFDSIKSGYDAVLVSVGAWTSTSIRCPGEDLDGVFGGIHFLRSVVQNDPVAVGKKVAIVGGGNTAMDACRTAVRLGAQKVYNIYRRTKAEMPAEDIEIKEAEEEGVIFKYLVNPLEILGGRDGKVSKIRLQKMRLGEADASGRRKPEPIPGDEELLDVDTVILALGQGIEPAGLNGLELTKGNTIIADELLFTTSEKGVFAIGDCVNRGASIAIDAVGNAKKAAHSIDKYLAGEEIFAKLPYYATREDLTAEDFADRKKEHRSQLSHLSPEFRRDNFLEISETFDAAKAKRDADRCLECGCHDFFECKLVDFAKQYDVAPDRFKESVKKVEFKDNHPFILRDPNKCILCGLCVRMCDEIVGSTALGLVDRGFSTVVMPSFEDSLQDTTCISCGQCISVCPTGALQERITAKKSIPLDTCKTDSVCGMCSVGCSNRVESVGGALVKNTPATDRGINNGIMCGKGRFGINYTQSGARITTPMIKKDGKLVSASWYDAFVYTAKKMESLRVRGEKTVVSLGHGYCVEDAGAIVNLAKALGADTFSYANRENGLAGVLGYDGSPNTLEELPGTNAIFVFGETMLSNPVILAKLRAAVKIGIPVTVVSPGEADFNLKCDVIKPANSLVFLKQAIKALIDSGCAPKNAEGFDSLKKALARVKPSADASAFAGKYKTAKKAMVLCSVSELSSEAMTLIADMAVISGHIGSPRNGIYLTRQLAGSQTVADLGVTASADAAKGAKGLMIFGEDAPASTRGIDFIMVQDTHMTQAAKKADVVFPMMAYPEIDGTFVNSERRLQKCHKAVDSDIEYRTSEIAQKIAEIIEKSAPAGDAARLYPGCAEGECFPATVLYTEGFEFPGGNARLQIPADAEMFVPLVQTGFLMNTITAALPTPKKD